VLDRKRFAYVKRESPEFGSAELQMLNFPTIRKQSLGAAATLGYQTNERLPLLIEGE
jgi:hypothetical protein